MGLNNNEVHRREDIKVLNVFHNCHESEDHTNTNYRIRARASLGLVYDLSEISTLQPFK